MRLARSLLFLAGVAIPCAQATGDLLIENVTLVSPERPQPLGGAHVLIKDGRISRVSSAPIALPSSTRRLDGTGKYLTPGLIDSHVHVSSLPGIPADGRDPALVALVEAYLQQQPRSYLYFGVTAVVDLAGAPEGLALFNAAPLHPRLFHCGPALVPGGYPWVLLPEPLKAGAVPYALGEPGTAQLLPSGSDPAEHTPEAVVDRIAKDGAACVKVFLEDGFGEASIWPIPSRETLARVIAAAHARRLPVVAHANAIDMQRLAVDAGVDVIAHGLWNWNQLDGEPAVPAGIADLMAAVHARGIGYQATLRVLPGLRALFVPGLLDDPRMAKVTPSALLAWFRTPAAGWFRQVLQADLGNATAEQIGQGQQAAMQQAQRALRNLFERGHELLLGSDTPSAPTYGNPPGLNTYLELELLADAGIPLDAILRAATLNNAKAFGLERELGTVEEGKRANLLLLTKNPLSAIEAWQAIETVILDGEATPRESLAAP